jgi:serine/threonine-protein kinase
MASAREAPSTGPVSAVPRPSRTGTGAHAAPASAAAGPAKAGGDKSEPPKSDPMIGTVIAGRYRIEARLGEGGMGSVYRVEHTHMRKKLALKVLHREMTSQPEIVARFEREAMAAAHIEHPNVAAATDFGKLEDGSCYLVLEYVEGPSLRGEIDKGPLPTKRALRITVQILGALKRAHELGIVHRDLKPENVLLVDKDEGRDFVKVLDFGIARVPIGAIGGEAGPSLTRAGMVYGTPEYMAPEQALGQEVDGRSDLYAAGVILFEMLTGRRPYDNKDKVALLGQHVAGPIPSARDRAPEQGISAELEAVVTRMLAKSPSDRFADASSAIEALFMSGEGTASVREAIEPSGSYTTSGQVVVSGEASRPDLAIRRPTSPLETASTMPPPAHPTRRVQPRIVAALVALATVLTILVVVIAVRKPQEQATSARGGGAPAVESAVTPPAATESIKARAQAALGRVTAGEVDEGIADLVALESAAPSDPVVLKALAQAYSKGKRHVDALSAVKRLVSASPESAADPALDAIVDDALAAPGISDVALTTLEGMGETGARILYAIAYEGRGPSAIAPRAKKALSDPEVQRTMPAAIRGAVELRNAPFACGPRKEIVEKYKSDFDATALPVLRTWTRTTGCGGFFKRGDCWPCLREERLLDKTIAAIEERTKKAL